MTSYLKENNLEELLQSSYKKGHSVETALVKVQSDVMLATDVGLVVVQVLLDLSTGTAFDTIDHSILLRRLKYRFGVSGPALEWFASYLSERYQYIRIGKLTSSKRQIPSGVPQGSVLGPLLFTMYISPLGDVIRKHGINFHMYADDVQLCVSFRPCDQKKALHELQHCLDDIHSWLRENRLLLKGNKTKMITFGTKQRLTVATNMHVTVDGCLISPDAITENLGIVYDSTLSMEHQVNAVCRGAYLRLHNISRIRRFLTQDATKTLIQAIVISKLDCGNALLSGVSTNLLRKLQLVQHMAARVITFTPRREHISPVLRNLHWLPIHRRIEFKILLLVYLCLHDIAPQYLAEMLTTHAATRSLRPTDKQLLVVPRSKLKRHGDRSFNVVAPILWNSLPESMKSSSSVASTFFFRQEYGVIN